MGMRGKGANLAIVTQLETEPRPAPPEELTNEQALDWNRTIGALPAEFFTAETLPLVTQYVRHISRARRFAQLIQDMEAGNVPYDLQLYQLYITNENIQSRTISSLAVKMRIAPQSSYDRSKRRAVHAHQASASVKPWDWSAEPSDQQER